MSIPINSSENKGCGSPTTTECVIWQGENLQCLGIEKGQKLSLSVKKLADEVCNLKSELDLSDLDLKCVFDLCLSCPEPEKTLKTVLQLLINKVCTIDEIIKNLETDTTGETVLIRLNQCFEFSTPDNTVVRELPHEEYTKRIANEVCLLKGTLTSLNERVSTLETKVVSLENDVENLKNQPETTINSCITGQATSLTQAVDVLDDAFCAQRNTLGTITNMNAVISTVNAFYQSLSAEDKALFASMAGFSISATNLSQAIRNIAIILSEMFSNVRTIQSTCCSFDCDDVKVGFVVAFEDGLEVVRLRFTYGSGTNIPDGFTDIGSKLTVSDESGNVLEFFINIENNGEVVLNLLGLNLGEKLTFSIETKLSNGDIVCSKCISKTVDSAAACNYCEITAFGSGTVTIVYEI